MPQTKIDLATQVTGTLPVGDLPAAAALVSAVQQDASTYAADTGAANAYAITLTPAPTLVAGSTACFKAANTNTGASTLATNGGSAIAIKANGPTTALVAGNITAGQIIDVTYDGTVWQMIVPGSGGGGALVAPVLLSTGAPTTIGMEISGSAGAVLTPTYVQSAVVAQNSNNTSIAASFTSNVTAGNCILVILGNQNDYAYTVSDNHSNTYTNIVISAAGYGYLCAFVALNVVGGATTITATCTSQQSVIAIHEYSGIMSASAYDQSATNPVANGGGIGNSGSYSTPNITTTAASDLIFAATAFPNPLSLAMSITTTGFTQRVSNMPNMGMVTADQVGAIGTYSQTTTFTAGGGPKYIELLILSLKAAPNPQTADLLEFKSSAGTVLSSVNAAGQHVMSSTAGSATNAPTAGALNFNTNTGNIEVFNAGVWTAVNSSASGAMSLISDQTLTSAAATVTFASIPGTYKHLLIYAQGRSTSSSADHFSMQANGDTAAHYGSAYVVSNNGTVFEGDQGSSLVAAAIMCDLPNTSTVANAATSMKVEIPNYAGTVFSKNAIVTGSAMGGTTISAYCSPEVFNWFWNSTAAITQLVMLAAGGSSFAIGTRFTLYGIN